MPRTRIRRGLHRDIWLPAAERDVRRSRRFQRPADDPDRADTGIAVPLEVRVGNAIDRGNVGRSRGEHPNRRRVGSGNTCPAEEKNGILCPLRSNSITRLVWPDWECGSLTIAVAPANSAKSSPGKSLRTTRKLLYVAVPQPVAEYCVTAKSRADSSRVSTQGKLQVCPISSAGSLQTALRLRERSRESGARMPLAPSARDQIRHKASRAAQARRSSYMSNATIIFIPFDLASPVSLPRGLLPRPPLPGAGTDVEWVRAAGERNGGRSRCIPDTRSRVCSARCVPGSLGSSPAGSARRARGARDVAHEDCCSETGVRRWAMPRSQPSDPARLPEGRDPR